MQDTNILDYLYEMKELLTTDDLDAVVQNLKALIESSFPNFYNELLVHLSKINRVRKEERMGFMSRSEINQEELRIRFALIALIDEISMKHKREKALSDLTSGILTNLKEERIEMDTINKIKILFLGANPVNTNRLRIDEELRKIDEGLQAAKFRERFKLASKWAVEMETLMKSMLDYEPQIVHFAGHGEQNGIILEKQDGTAHIVPLEALKKLFNLFKNEVQCVLLNACYSEEQAKIISEHSIYVVGMNNSLNDKAAIDFAVGFYQSIGAGKDYEFAYQMGITLLMSRNLSQADIPILWKDGERIEL